MPHPNLPPKLYKYQPFNAQTLTNLQARTLWFASPEDFNDPFDCADALGDGSFDLVAARHTLERWIREGDDVAPGLLREFDADPRRADELVEEFRSGMRSALARGSELYLRNRGVACLSARPDHLLMWSHYADGHRGFCLEFSTNREPFSRALPCDYRTEAARIDEVGVITRSIPEAHIVERVMLTKCDVWAYEAEWRILHKQQRIRYTYDSQDLTGVYFGAAMSDDRKDLLGQILSGSRTKLNSMRRAENAFAVNPVPFASASYADPADGPEPQPDNP